VTLVLTWEVDDAHPIRVVRDFADWWIARACADELAERMAEEVREVMRHSAVTRELSVDDVPWSEVARIARVLLDGEADARGAGPPDR
jgi:hypothetical protein